MSHATAILPDPRTLDEYQCITPRQDWSAICILRRYAMYIVQLSSPQSQMQMQTSLLSSVFGICIDTVQYECIVVGVYP